SRDFKNIVWPVFSEWLGGGKIIPIETIMDSKFCELLDMTAGIDAWQIINFKGIRGIASRIQWGKTNWRSWTIRYEKKSGYDTEFQRLTNNDKTLLKATYHIQAYIDKKRGKLLGAACIKTEDLIDMLNKDIYGILLKNPQDNTLFIPVWWSSAKRNGYDVFIYNSNENQQLRLNYKVEK
ncbi:unnamed protein product, partial [marine sediment metagenome]